MIEVSSTLCSIENVVPDDRLVRMLVNGKSEMLPANPFKTAAILAKRSKNSPAAKAKAKMVAAAKARGI